MSKPEDILNKPRILLHSRKSLNYTVYHVDWIPNSARFVSLGCTPSQKGALQIFSLEETDIKLQASSELPFALRQGTFGQNRKDSGLKDLACVDVNGNLYVIDIEKLSSNPKPTYHISNAHSGMINCIDGAGSSFGAPEVVTGGSDGCVRIWDTRQSGRPVASLEPDGTQRDDCWSVAMGNSYNDTERVVAAGFDGGDIKLFDLRMNKITWEHNIKNGVCSLEFDRSDIEMNKLLATTLEGRFTVFDMRTFNEQKGYASVTEKISKDTLWQGKHLPQNRDIWAICGGQGKVSLFQYKYPAERSVGDPPAGVPGRIELIQSQTFSTQPMYSLSWHKNKEGLAVMGSLDQSIYVAIVTKLEQYR